MSTDEKKEHLEVGSAGAKYCQTMSTDEKKEHLEAYSAGAKDLRTWLLAYGIGAPALLLSNKELYGTVAKSPYANGITILFLFGVRLQVAIALMNKWLNWFLYSKFDYSKTLREQTSGIKRCHALSENAWIDISIDIFSFILFAGATAYTVTIFI